MKHYSLSRIYVLLGVLLIVMISGAIILYNPTFTYTKVTGFSLLKNRADEGVAQFGSSEAFQEYLLAAEQVVVNAPVMFERSVALESSGLPGAPEGMLDMQKTPETSRVSETNVQVVGIDEPDIVKTDGKELYVSHPQYYYMRGGSVPEPLPIDIFSEEDTNTAVSPLIFNDTSQRILPPERSGGVSAVKAFPPADLAVDSTFDASGDLLLYENTLIAFENQNITAYNVEDPKNPKKTWNAKLENSTYVVTSRLVDGMVYVITGTHTFAGIPCPIIPLTLNNTPVSVPCRDIYHPLSPVPVDSTYTVLKINPSTGDTESTVSFVGSQHNTVVYMSHNALYISYQQELDSVSFLTQFLLEHKDIVPAWVLNRLQKLTQYDIGRNAKFAELNDIMNQFRASLDNDERVRIENELQNRMASFFETHKREFQKTGIARISLQNLSVDAHGVVPGRLLNQFSLDEYEGYLRVATTIDEQFFGLGGIGIGRSGESVNDVYILNNMLTIAGSVKDLGKDERIFSARFIGDRGYLVTFKQIDPFFVLDLSHASQPRVAGELKIPGFSSYLQPLGEQSVLGVGREDSQVKLSLFDVSSPDNPQEISKYILNEYWSDILNTHRAFLLDSDNELFFIPGSNAGYMFSYKNNSLTLEKAIANISARRAVFINNYFYIIGNDKIVVLNMNDWERVNELALSP